jgi:sulfur-oxidizing protein SoxZ
MLARLQVPETAKAGSIVSIRIAIQHAMENGFRRAEGGARVPQNIINRLVCRYGGREVFRVELGPGVAANPFLEFFVRVEASGPIEVEWYDESGARGEARAELVVSA